MMPISHRVRQQHPEFCTGAIVLHAQQGDRGCPSPTVADLILKGSAVGATSMQRQHSADKGLALRAAAARHAGCAGRRNCNVNLDDLDQDRPDLNCEPLQAPGTARNLQLDETNGGGGGG